MELFSKLIMRGNQVEAIIASKVDNASNIHVAPDGSKMYWRSASSKSINRANLDGSEAELIIQNTNALLGSPNLAVDFTGETIYWEDSSWVHRSDLMGNDAEPLVKIDRDWAFVNQIEVDIANEKLYWAELSSGQTSFWKSNLDGTMDEQITSVSSSNRRF